MKTAPIALFVYDRPWHTRETIEALKNNELAEESDLYIFSDAAKNTKEENNVAEVREYIRAIKGFREVNITENEKNRGLADNIISGVTGVVEQQKRIIVLEDDIVTSPVFLTFMNRALDYYADKDKIWHVSGWNYPIDSSGLGDVFSWRVMNCWGWATWEDRWKNFEKEPDDLIDMFTKEEISRFDLDDCGAFWNQVLDNANGKINTWAIFWYAAIFRHNALCLNPTISYVKNIGHDGSGENCTTTSTKSSIDLNDRLPMFSDDLVESELAVSKIRNYYRKSGSRRISSAIDAARSYAKRLSR